MQELIEIIKEKRKESDISNTFLRFCQVEAEKLLEKEKQVIEDAYSSHCTFMSCEENKNNCKCGKDYYNQKFKQ